MSTVDPGDHQIDDPHLVGAHQVAERLNVDLERGLASAEVESRRQRHGANRLPDPKPRRLWQRVADQFRQFMILVLLAAAVLSGLIGDLVDTLAIVAIVLLNAAIGLSQEWRADRAIQALKRLAAVHATVRRDGGTTPVDAEHLVPGDVVLLEAGNLVPADLRLHQVAQLKVDESTLTGESVTAEKHAAPLPAGEHALGDRCNMAFKGTLVTHGRASGLVVATGARTQLGQVATLLNQETDRSTPLQARLAVFGKRLSLIVLVICAVIFAIGVLRGEPVLLMALTAISLAVASIPEALPAVTTVLLALGASRLVRLNALVRRLPSVETLGSVTVICSDKTGTLTQNRMQAREQHCWGGLPHTELWLGSLLCNDAVRDGAGHWTGDPTETALAEAAQAAGLSVQALTHAHPRLQEWPFDSERKRMSTLHGDGERWLSVTKGAPETVLPRCTRVATAGGEVALDTAEALRSAEAMAAQGMRVLAVARRTWQGCPAVAPLDKPAGDIESDLTLLGLVGLTDPPRPGAKAAVTDCRSAGIIPVMITGDHPATALAIALELGIVEAADANVLTGLEMVALDDAGLAARMVDTRVYARVDPAQKIRIVAALQAQGHFVAMTGDGVNDAPALKRADIGVAMGLGGSDVAREAADLVLLDDNFATIVAAVREGRRIFDNIRKFIRYAMTGNSGEIWTLFLAPLLALPIPLLPIHILWINLVTDGVPGLALAAEPAERGVMKRPPRPTGESVFAGGLWQHTLWAGLLIGALCLGMQAWALREGRPWQTMVFTLLTLSQMAHVLAIRSRTQSLFTQGLRSNLPLTGAVVLSIALQLATVYLPFLQPIFRTEALSLGELGLCVAAASVVFIAVEIEKAVQRQRARARSRRAGSTASKRPLVARGRGAG
jgi:Ca2+-transporting ATPase